MSDEEVMDEPEITEGEAVDETAPDTSDEPADADADDAPRVFIDPDSVEA